MLKFMRGAVLAMGLAGAALVATGPATAAGIVGVHIGPVGIGLGVNNGHYYDRHHRRQTYSYPSDYRSYHHPRSWYRGHSQWNQRDHHDYYRK